MEDDPTYHIAIAHVCGRHSIPDSGLIEAVRATLDRHHVSAGRISVALVDDPRMAELNEAHLNHKGATDVLTFDLGEPGREGVEGEIVLSVDTAHREAHRRGHSLEAELALYAVHGTLHLLGLDDGSQLEAVKMHEVEDEILASLGYGQVFGKPST